MARYFKITREPKIEMNDVERGSDRPGEIHFTLPVAPNVVGDAMSPAFDPIGNVLTHPRPMEPEAKTKQCFIETNMGTTRPGMKVTENLTTEGRGNNDEANMFFIAVDWFEENQFTMNKLYFVVAKIRVI